ncbi:BTB/POZ domain-containing protein At2g46260-like [Elaeis guineensis]|uniref:BTB/POZ domain-containing protein At2g46260-like n=1 Tax=Elaeis guineensis var. tenera TaxID=51953 RepID=A0A6J0PCL2_ELAGV|nr:BTB/POZ domain-containing protein At2g46260-like [Elaeis guineensis]
MESPKQKVEGDGRKTLRRFMKRELIDPTDQPLRVRIVAKPQPDGGEHIGTEDSLKPEAELFDDTNNGNGAPCGTYISRRSRGVDYSTSGGGSVEEVMDVNSELLSQESLVFRKLFKETKTALLKEPPTIQIEASEEHAFVALLEFICFSRMPPPSYEECVDLLMTAEEFQVLSCAYRCTNQLLRKLNSALSCFELCHKLRWPKVKELLAMEAMNFVTQTDNTELRVPKQKEDHDIMSIKNELLQQPFSIIKALFCMDYLKVESEDDVYDFILCWAQTHYPKPEDHCTAKELHLERLIRFTYLTCRKLEDALQCDFFHPESVSEAVMEALAFKVREPYRRRLPPGGCSSNRFLERCYKRVPVAVNRLWFPEFDRCEVYFSLAISELLDMHYSLGRRESEDFQFGPQLLSLVASYKEVRRTFYFDLSITSKGEILDENVHATRFMAMTNVGDSAEFVEMGTGTFVPAKQETAGGLDLLPGFLLQLLNGVCPFILDGFLHLLVEITCKR